MKLDPSRNTVAVPATATAANVVRPRAIPVAPPRPVAFPVAVEDDRDEERPSLVEMVRSTLTCPEMIVTECSSVIHFILVVLLAMISVQTVKKLPPPVLTASVNEREPPKPDLDITPELDQPKSAAAGPMVRAVSAQVAPTLAPMNFGVKPVAVTLPGLNDMIFRDAVKTGGAGGIDAVSFFGAASYAKKVVFVVDNSMSMKGKKFTRCKEELLTAISGLSPRQQFFVVFFSDKEHLMLEPSPPKDVVQLDTKMWEGFSRWLDELQLSRGTRAQSALEKALSLKPDVVYVLTDGAFTDKAYEYLMDLEDTKVKINTIGFQASAKGKEILQAIAERFKGEFTDIR